MSQAVAAARAPQSVVRTFALPLLGCLLAAGTGASAAEWELRVQSDRHSDFSSIDGLRDDNAAGYRARSGNNLAYLLEEARLQRRDGAWTLALLGRTSATLIGNEDAVDALRHSRGLGRDASDRHFGVQARLRGFAGAGVEVGRAFELAPQWRGALQVQALALTNWRDREVRGGADFAAASSTYTFDLRSTESNERLDFPFRQSQGSYGGALLFGGEIGWTQGDWSVRGALHDVGVLHWRGMPQQEFTLATSTRTVDADGFVVFDPLLQGRNAQSDLTRAAPWRAQLDAGWRATERGELQLGARWFQGFGALPSVGWSQRWGALQAGATWQVHERRLVLQAQWGGWHLVAGADRFGNAHSRVLGVGYTRAFSF